MNISKRFTNAIKSFNNTQPSNSSGAVIRNYGKQSTFRPQEQFVGITYKAIDKIGQVLSTYEPYVVDTNGKVIENHPMLSIFHKPNPRWTSADFIHMYGMLFEIYGETFWYMAKGVTQDGLTSGKVKEIYLLNPASIELQIHEGVLIGYILHKANGDQVPLLLEEIIHDKRPNPFNEWRGMSALERASTYVDIENTTSRFTLNYMRNNASPSGIVSLPTMSPETFKQFAQQWREGYEGAENAGKTAFIRGGEVDFKAVGATLHDIDQKITRDMAKDDVLMMFDVPKPLLGMSDGSGFGRGNVEALNYIFAVNKIEPMMERLDRIYEKILLGTTYQEGGLDIEHESPIPEDKEFMLKSNTAGINVWITINEARARENLPPLRDGDVLVQNNPANIIQPVSGKKLVLKKALTKTEIAKNVKSKNEAFRKELVAVNDIYASKIKHAISKFADKQGAKVIANILASHKAYEEWLPSIKEESITLAEILTPLMLDLIEAQGADVANFITGELLTITPEVRKAVESNILKISGAFNEETIRAIEAVVTQAVTDGASLVKIKSSVEQVFADAKGYRAERIAQTESLRTTNATAEQVYFQNGFSAVTWFINPDACEFCQTFEGQTKSIGAGSSFAGIGDVITTASGSTMSIGYDNVETPPLHPNCKCSLVPAD